MNRFVTRLGLAGLFGWAGLATLLLLGADASPLRINAASLPQDGDPSRPSGRDVQGRDEIEGREPTADCDAEICFTPGSIVPIGLKRNEGAEFKVIRNPSARFTPDGLEPEPWSFVGFIPTDDPSHVVLLFVPPSHDRDEQGEGVRAVTSGSLNISMLDRGETVEVEISAEQIDVDPCELNGPEAN